MLTELQRTTLAAFADQILPPDDQPGGAAVGAVGFVEALLAGDLASRAAEYTTFLDRLAAAGFAELPFEDQTALLRQWESEPIFRLAAETIHEVYWTSAAGKARVGFTEKG